MARVRAVVRRYADRVPGGAPAVACAALGLLALLHGCPAVVLRTPSPLIGLPVVVAATAVLPPSRRRLMHEASAAVTALSLLSVAGLWLRGERPVGTTVALVLGLLAAFGVALAVAAREHSLLTALEVSRAAVDAVSVRDPLTGVANRQGLDMIGRQVVETARRQGDAAHCTFVEIGGLAEARTTHGPDAVADVLVALSEALRSVTRTTDVVARWKDATFCVVGQGAGMDPVELERRVRRRLGADSALDRSVWSGRITVGGAMLPPWDAGTLETLLVRAAEELRARGVARPVVEPAVPRHDPATGADSL